ncbi:complement component C8 beta [Schistosoma japonicum]|uniref:Complement component C8 beta n=1 Tax=Schistosoma japonicum TaxID=6182 RepID=A0A4Z2DM64_SCHJA|nr:complement component C8 beta [Schistosoma japonicum]
MVYTLTVLLVYIITGIRGLPVENSEKYSRNILLRELLNFQLPKDSNFQSISSLSPTAWNPTLSALLWTSWSKWERCTQNKYCVNNKTENIDNLIIRTRVCQFQSMNEQLLWSQTMFKGINLSSEIIPCSEEGLIQSDVQHCRDLYQCIYESHNFASSINHSLNAMSKSDIKDFISMDTTENQFKTEDIDNLTTERHLKRNKIWGPWTTLQQCSSIIPTIDELPDEYPWELMLNLSRAPAGRRCEPGLQLQARKLLDESTTFIKKRENFQDEQQNSPSQSLATSATITETRKIHCWINEACHTSDVKVEPPTTCFFQAIYRSPSVQVKWRRTPYGRMPSHFEVHVLDLINSIHQQKSELYVEQVKLNKFDSWGENYMVEIFGLKIGQLYEISVGSSDEMNNLYFSKSCEAIVIIGAGDGSWSKWSSWSNCNSKCASKLGTRSRYRKCNSPAPTNGGRVCPGSEQMHLECFGTNISC